MMRYFLCFVVLLAGLFVLIGCEDNDGEDIPADNSTEEVVALPDPMADAGAVARAIYNRVSYRNFADKPLTTLQAGKLLWAAGGLGVDGVTGPSRTAPSAGATYPLDFYLVAGKVDGMAPGVYRYDYQNHSLLPLVMEDKREQLAGAALNQQFIIDAPVSIVMVAHHERTTSRYGERGKRYVDMDAGYASQNIYLQATELDLGTVAVGAFDDAEVAAIINTTGKPLKIMPVGIPAE